MSNSATIVSASLDDNELRQSIANLVAYYKRALHTMSTDTDKTVSDLQNKLKLLGNIKIDSGGAADGGSTRRAKLFSQEGEVIQRNNQIAKEYNTTLDQQAAAIRKASQVSVRTGDAGSIRNADTLQTMNIQLDLLRERLREARNQYSSFVALASHATTTGDKGLYQFATEGVHKYGDEVRTLIPQIRGLQNAIQQMGDVIAPQGHTIQNYVNSLQKANPELAALNEQFKKGQSALQQQNVEQQKSISFTEEESQKLQALQNRLQQLKNDRKELSKAMQDAGWDRFGAKIQLGAYPDDTNLKNKLIDAENRYAVAKQKIAQVDKEIVSIESEINGVRSGFASSIQQTVQSAHQYTEEIRKQAQAIRASKEWQEKGYYRIGEASFYNPETSRLAKKDIISLEEQILRWKQKQTEETDKTTRSEYQYSEAVRNAADALRAQLHGTKAASIDVGGRTIYNEKEAGSIESQLTALMKDRTKEFNLQHEVALAIEQDEKRISEELAKQRQTSDGAKKTKEAETYRQMIAKTLGIQESQVKLANAETASYEQLDATLKQLVRTKNRLGSEGLNSAFGKGLLEDIREVEAAMQRIKKFGYNKVSLSNALGLSEKSLDDIARKSQQLQYVMKNVDTTTEEGARAFQRASLNARI